MTLQRGCLISHDSLFVIWIGFGDIFQIINAQKLKKTF